jgi:hypothetical protein
LINVPDRNNLIIVRRQSLLVLGKEAQPIEKPTAGEVKEVEDELGEA